MTVHIVQLARGEQHPVEADHCVVHPSGALMFGNGAANSVEVVLAFAPHEWRNVQPMPPQPPRRLGTHRRADIAIARRSRRVQPCGPGCSRSF
jgi:hypothetical protein